MSCAKQVNSSNPMGCPLTRSVDQNISGAGGGGCSLKDDPEQKINTESQRNVSPKAWCLLNPYANMNVPSHGKFNPGRFFCTPRNKSRKCTGNLSADQICRLMLDMKNGKSLTSDPNDYANTIIEPTGPMVKMRQNQYREVEANRPLPILKVLNFNLSEIDEMCTFAISFKENLPASNIAFPDESVIKSVDSKVYKGLDGNNFVHNIKFYHLEDDYKFAISPVQLGNWFPGMCTVYPDYCGK